MFCKKKYIAFCVWVYGMDVLIAMNDRMGGVVKS